ncbi:hypothetical protein AWB69_01465 [Caballeronia udeis]|uniref:Uncharacterized protein n=2 Tax=Caballeronia udeis TaxID=1232866 RepID=A0A158FPN9_9BURK|nr:hypothetical protein AWB69_01465 [Caballeronia udeis]
MPKNNNGAIEKRVFVNMPARIYFKRIVMRRKWFTWMSWLHARADLTIDTNVSPIAFDMTNATRLGRSPTALQGAEVFIILAERPLSGMQSLFHGRFSSTIISFTL